MAIRLTTTAESSSHIKVLVYGESGVGKTYLCKTAPKPVIISAEKGLLTLKRERIPVIEISSFEDLEDAYVFVTTNEKAQQFQTICLDSISDIAETILAEEKENCGADPRQAYMFYVDKLLPMIKKFRDIEGKHVYFTAKMKRTKDEFTGITSYGPSMPGQVLGPQLPYLFDFVFFLGIGEDEDTGSYRYLQTESDIQRIAKARGGTMDPTEPPDLTHIFERGLSYELAEEREDEEVSEGEKEIEIDGSFEEDDEDGTPEEETEQNEEEVEEESQEEETEDDEEPEEDDEPEDESETLDEAAEAAMAGEED